MAHNSNRLNQLASLSQRYTISNPNLSVNFLRYLLGLLVILLTTSVASAQHYEAGGVHIHSPWSRELPPTSPNGAVYMTFTNHGAQPDKLLSASTDIAELVEIHTHIVEDGLMKMRRVESVDLSPHKEVLFAPGGYHFMLIGLKRPLEADDRFQFLLEFEQAGQALVEVVVQSTDDQSTAKTGHSHGSTTTSDSGPVKRFDLHIHEGKVKLDDQTIRVTQGDHIEVTWSSDKSIELHLHGYDIHTYVAPNSPAIMHFKAHATGRFPVEIHGKSQHSAVIYIEVHPK